MVEEIRQQHPEFGWPEWPLKPYLGIDPEERKKRLCGFFLQTSDYALAKGLDPLLSYLGSSPIIAIQLRYDMAETEAVAAFRARWRIECGNSELPRKERVRGRGSQKAVWHDWLRALAVYRLLNQYNYTAEETLWLLINTYGDKCPYSSNKSVRRAERKAKGYIKQFNRKAQKLARDGVWFFPFSGHLMQNI